MKTKTILIIIVVVIAIAVIGYYTFPLVLALFKTAMGIIALLLVALGIAIGTIVSKLKK
jgi:uncharacterized membrane protein